MKRRNFIKNISAATAGSIMLGGMLLQVPMTMFWFWFSCMEATMV